MDSIVSILKNSVLAIVRILEVRDDPVNSSKTISSSPIKVEVDRVVVAAKERLRNRDGIGASPSGLALFVCGGGRAQSSV